MRVRAAMAVGIGLGLMAGLSARPHLEVSERQLQLARYNELLAAGTTAFARGAYQAAAGHFEAAQAILPEHPLAYLEAGQACFAWGEFLRAGEHLRAGVRRRPSWPRAPGGLARLRRRPQLMSQRAAELEAELQRSRNLEVLFLKGTLEHFRGERASALATFEAARSLAPGDLPTRLFLSALARGEATTSKPSPLPATATATGATAPAGWISR